MIANKVHRNKRHHSPIPLQFGCDDNWNWDDREKSHEVCLCGPNYRTAHFHPKWSNGTAGVRGTRVINRCFSRFYWEIYVSERVFGTSMMFGICTKNARLHADSFVNMLGEDEYGWGLSHKGLLWHCGQWKTYTKPFRENEATVVGILFDAKEGTLSYFKDGVSLGIAFTDLDIVEDDLYPMICSTAAKTEMTLTNMRREYYNLQDRCRDVIRKRMKSDDITKLYLPNRIAEFLKSESDESHEIENNFQISNKRQQICKNMRSQYSYICGNFGNIYTKPPVLEL